MNWIEVLAIWVLASIIVTPFIGDLLYKRRVKRELESLLFQALQDSAVSDRESRRVPDLARDAVIPITDSAWQDRARKAEGLGFLDDDQPELPRAS